MKRIIQLLVMMTIPFFMTANIDASEEVTVEVKVAEEAQAKRVEKLELFDGLKIDLSNIKNVKRKTKVKDILKRNVIELKTGNSFYPEEVEFATMRLKWYQRIFGREPHQKAPHQKEPHR